MKKSVIIDGLVVHGKGLGKTVGMPTANLECDVNKLNVDIGVYASKVYINNTKDKFYIGVTNIGTRPSVDNNSAITIETNILNFDEDIYGKLIRVELIKKIRDIIKFNNLQEVKEQVDKDKKKAIKIIEGKKVIELFITFFKIGAFTFGGGYGMISLVKDECVDKKKWLDNEEFVNLIAVAESTPGPIAINMATYIGYKKAKFIGAILSTIAVVLPSIIIIYLITLYFKDFLNIKIVADAFMGIRVAIGLIIIKSAYKLIKDEMVNSKYKKLTLFLFELYFLTMFVINYFNLNISSVVLILSSLFLGLVLRKSKSKEL